MGRKKAAISKLEKLEKDANDAVEAMLSAPDVLDGNLPSGTPMTLSDISTSTESVTVYDPRGNAHRTYSASIHGEGFKELAEEYVSRRPGWTAR